MKEQTGFLFCLLIFFAVIAHHPLAAQTQKAPLSRTDSLFLNRYKIYALGQIDSLKKQGAVVVVLRSNTRAIQAYEKAGKTKIAEEMKSDVQLNNRYLSNAFRTKFNFCPVYFIYGDDLNAFIKGNRDGVFVDSTLKKNALISMPQLFYVLIEYGTLYEIQNKESDWAPGKFRSENTGNLDPSAGSPSVENCLVVKDRQLFQYRYPFPYFAQVKFGIKTVDATVERLNMRFFNFYKRLFEDE